MTDFSRLVGPEPEPVNVPKHPLPWKVSRTWGYIYDGNGNHVATINSDRAEAKLAEAIVEAMNAHFDPPKDVALRSFEDKDGDLWFEVAPDLFYMEESRSKAVTYWERYPGSGTPLENMITGPWRPFTNRVTGEVHGTPKD
jgi:hypothetical protein